MPFAAAPYDQHTRSLMMAALETAWMAAGLSVPGLSDIDRARMVTAILDAVARGERDFKRLQQAAFDGLGLTALSPVERRQQLRLVEGSVDRRQT